MHRTLPDGVSGWSRRFAYLYLGAFLLCGVFGLEVWPLTGWRMFCNLRPRRQSAFQVMRISAGGAEAPVSFAALGAGFQGNVQVLNAFASLSSDQKLAVCRVWAESLRDHHLEVAGLRIYRLEWDVSHRRGARAAPPDTCVLNYAWPAAPGGHS